MALPANIRLGEKDLSVTNTLAYLAHSQLTAEKSLYHWHLDEVRENFHSLWISRPLVPVDDLFGGNVVRNDGLEGVEMAKLKMTTISVSRKNDHCGTTFKIMRLSIMTLSIMTLRIMTYSIKAVSITTLSITTLSVMTFSIVTLNILTHSIMTLSITTLSIMTLSIMTLNIITLSIMTLSITINKTGHSPK